jgi:pimeloyl-ACP methyl ester carboxylesterase
VRRRDFAPPTKEDIAMTRAHVASFVLLASLASGPGCSSVPDAELSPATASKPSIVLVHGAFADASSWRDVIPLLQRDGYSVTAVQNPLASLTGDVETTKRVIAAQPGAVVVVGHSYGGAVITEAAAGNPNVKALVYVAAFAPEVNEAIGAFGEKYPNALGAGLRPDAAGFLYIDRAQFRDLFAADVPESETRVLAATQKPVIGSVFGASVSQAAWKTVPTWYLVTQDDHAIAPELQRLYARRMGATTLEVKSSHVPFVSHPREVARFIEQAAGAAGKP